MGYVKVKAQVSNPARNKNDEAIRNEDRTYEAIQR